MVHRFRQSSSGTGVVEQIFSIVSNACTLISSILPSLHDFDEKNDKIRLINNDLEHNTIRHTVFILVSPS